MPNIFRGNASSTLDVIHQQHLNAHQSIFQQGGAWQAAANSAAQQAQASALQGFQQRINELSNTIIQNQVVFGEARIQVSSEPEERPSNKFKVGDKIVVVTLAPNNTSLRIGQKYTVKGIYSHDSVILDQRDGVWSSYQFKKVGIQRNLPTWF
jgi:hypothetical protein